MADQDKSQEDARLKGGMGQQGGLGASQSTGQSAGQSSDEGSGRISGGHQTNSGGAALNQNDQAGGGLGQNHAGYGSGTNHDPTGGQGPGEVTQGAQGQTGNLGPNPSAGSGQAADQTTGGPDLSKGLTDNNKGGGGL